MNSGQIQKIVAPILVIDDDPDVLVAARILLKHHFEPIVTEANPARLPTLLEKEHFGVILLDMNFAMGEDSGSEGLFWLKKILDIDPKAAYVHLTSNNTIAGTQWQSFPDTGDVPLVADMSSDLLWKPFDANKFSLIYAGAQKNLGPSGVTLVIIRKSWLEQANSGVPTLLSYATHVAKDSLYNTPPSFSIYMVRNVLSWVRDNGGAEGMERLNRAKAGRLYGVMAAFSGFYRCPVDEDSRSCMNVVFRLPSEDLEARFVAEAKNQGMVGLKGHRSVGGCRASIYNAMPAEGVETLAQFMEEFARTHG